MVYAYMDESGIHDGAHVCVVAGYFGSEKKWASFDERWRETLKSTGEATLREFHSTEFWASDGTRRGVFAGWSNDKAAKFIDDLLDCIVESRLYPTAAALVADEF